MSKFIWMKEFTTNGEMTNIICNVPANYQNHVIPHSLNSVKVVGL